MNLLVEIVLILAGGIAIYAIVVSLFTLRAIKQKRYKAYRRKQADFDRLDQEVKKAFEENKQ